MSYKTQVHRFFTKYAPDPKDPAIIVGTDWVEYGPPGARERTSITSRISTISRVMPLEKDASNPAIIMANDRWAYIKPLYEAWKSGQDLPETGTPLAAWNGLTTEQADALRMRGVKTVEEIAEMTDAIRTRVGLPGMVRMQEAAKLFIQSKDTVKVASALEQKDKEIADLKLQMEEMMSMLSEVREEKKRGPGRPPKSESVAA